MTFFVVKVPRAPSSYLFGGDLCAILEYFLMEKLSPPPPPDCKSNLEVHIGTSTKISKEYLCVMNWQSKQKCS